MILAYHAIFTTYGTWLPNDPRGSYSTEIYNNELKLLGEIKYGRQKPSPNRTAQLKFRTAAISLLGKPPFYIDENSRPIVADSFGEVVGRLGIKVGACAIMNDHVHMLIIGSEYRIEYIVNQLKGGATKALKLKSSPWTRGCWKVFINDTAAIKAAANYIKANPVKAGLTAQSWDFVSD